MKRLVTLLLCAMCVVLPAVHATDKPIRLIVPVPAGGPSDTVARSLADGLARSLGQPVVVENKPGASGAIAARALLAGPADGTTLLWTLASMTGIPMLQKSPPYQSLNELAPVSLVGRFAFGMFINPAVPAQSVGEFVRYVRANPDKTNYGTGTLGEYMAAAQFIKATGIQIVRIPYKGGSQLMPDLISGRLQMNFGPVASRQGYVKEGKLRLLAVLLPARSAAVPDVPTLTETGVASVSLPTWQAIFAPPHTPRAVTERLAQEVAHLVNEPALHARFEALAFHVEGSTPDELAHVVAADQDAWRTFVRENNLPRE